MSEVVDMMTNRIYDDTCTFSKHLFVSLSAVSVVQIWSCLFLVNKYGSTGGLWTISMDSASGNTTTMVALIGFVLSWALYGWLASGTTLDEKKSVLSMGGAALIIAGGVMSKLGVRDGTTTQYFGLSLYAIGWLMTIMGSSISIITDKIDQWKMFFATVSFAVTALGMLTLYNGQLVAGSAMLSASFIGLNVSNALEC